MLKDTTNTKQQTIRGRRGRPLDPKSQTYRAPMCKTSKLGVAPNLLLATLVRSQRGPIHTGALLSLTALLGQEDS